MKEKKEPASMEGEKIRVGTALIKQLSSSFYPKTYMIFDELVSNSRDAGATEVKLGIYKDHIEVDDNGDGMESFTALYITSLLIEKLFRRLAGYQGTVAFLALNGHLR